MRYWNTAFQNPDVAGSTVPVRYEPYDMGAVYAFVQGQWLECIADDYAQVHGRAGRMARTPTATRQEADHGQWHPRRPLPRRECSRRAHPFATPARSRSALYPRSSSRQKGRRGEATRTESCDRVGLYPYSKV
ncbi:MAG: hypothetical protein ACJ8BW_10650 [Ktedonobacteraceae bacterium]